MAPKANGKSLSADSDPSSKGGSLWFAASPSKRWAEMFFLAYSPVWITWALGVIVPLQLYKRFDEWGYMMVGLAAALPCVLVPPFLLCPADRCRPWYDQFWVKANVWIAVFSFVGNYFWTHYFYRLLGASYTFPSWRLNDVPIPLYLLTHAYFCFYHAISNITIRRLRHAVRPALGVSASIVVEVAWVLLLSYVTAFMETLTIANFDYYTFVDKEAMYRIGSLFYALYFVVSFPMYFRIEEAMMERWTLVQVAVDSLGASMLVTILLDLWRISIGPITQVPKDLTCRPSMPWM